jgi:biotin-dependent carboxylase-like uncharacterized protein
MNVLEVMEPGLLTTIQDHGRFGHEAEGVPRSGAADSIGLAVSNLLLGNPPDAAAIECTLLGPRLRALVDIEVGLAGTDLGAVLESDGTALAPGASHHLSAGDVVGFRGPDEADGAGGCRAYVAIPGGIDVPLVLGSRSTCLPAGFGGIDGRALRVGDRIPASDRMLEAQRTSGPRAAGARLSAGHAAALPSPAQRIRILPGPASGAGDPARAGITDRAWIVDPASDRRGLRLQPADPGANDGNRLEPLAAGELPSHGVLPGAIQVSPSGQPLVLMPDSGTTGGYPVVAVVIHADLPILGQLAPGAEVRFRETSVELARVAELERRALLQAIGERRDRVTRLT